MSTYFPKDLFYANEGEYIIVGFIKKEALSEPTIYYHRQSEREAAVKHWELLKNNPDHRSVIFMEHCKLINDPTKDSVAVSGEADSTDSAFTGYDF